MGSSASPKRPQMRKAPEHLSGPGGRIGCKASRSGLFPKILPIDSTAIQSPICKNHMKFSYLWLLCLMIPISGCKAGARSPSSPLTPISGHTDETILRRSIVYAVLPEYPPSSVARGSYGVAVARVDLDVHGNVDTVRIYEAPDKDTAEAVIRALHKWKFKELKSASGTPYLLNGVITFYFALKDNTGIVLNPDQAGYIGRQFNENLGLK